MSAALPVNAIERVAVACHDCRAATEHFSRFFGVREWRLAECGPAGSRYRSAIGSAGGVGLELIEPLDASGPFGEFLATHGPGLMHVVLRPEQGAEVAAAALQAAGVTVQARLDDQWVMDSRSVLGGLGLVLEPVAAARPHGEVLHYAHPGVLPVQQLYQVAMIVPDLDALRERFAAVLGIEQWVPIELAPGPMLAGCEYYGEPVEHSARLAIGRSGNACFELIEPGSGPTVYRDALERHGPCMHHIMATLCPPEDFDVAARELRGAGIVVGQQAAIPGLMQFAYFDGGEALSGVFVEVISPLADNWLELMFPSPEVARIVVGDA